MENTPQVAVDYAAGVADRPQVQALMRENTTYIEAMEMLRSMAGKGAHHSPKLARLTQILRRHFATSDAGSRVIVFTSFRDSVHDIVRALREVTLAKGPLEPDAPQVDPGKGQGTITGMFHAANGGGDGGGGGGVGSKGGGFEEDGGVGYLPGVGEADDGTGCRIKVAEFIGQGDTSRGGRGGAGAARGGRASRRRSRRLLWTRRAGALNTIVATSIGEEGLDIPAVDLIVFFDVVDIIRTIQRMGRTGRRRREGGGAGDGGEGGGQVQQGAGQLQPHAQVSLQPGARLSDVQRLPANVTPGLHPRCELEELGPTPDQLRVKRATEQTSSGKPRQPRGAAAAAAGSFPVRPWDAPLTAVETSLLSAYDHEPGALHSVDYRSTAPLQRRPTAVYGVPHGRWTGLLTRFVSAARGLPPPARPEGELIRGGPLARARDAEEEAALARRLAEEENAEREEADARAGTPDEAITRRRWNGTATRGNLATRRRRTTTAASAGCRGRRRPRLRCLRRRSDAVERRRRRRMGGRCGRGSIRGVEPGGGEGRDGSGRRGGERGDERRERFGRERRRERRRRGSVEDEDAHGCDAAPRFFHATVAEVSNVATHLGDGDCDDRLDDAGGCRTVRVARVRGARVFEPVARVRRVERGERWDSRTAARPRRARADDGTGRRGDALGQTKPASPSAAESARRRLLARQSQLPSQPRSQPRPRDDGDDVDDETLGDVALSHQTTSSRARRSEGASADRRDERAANRPARRRRRR